MNSIPGFRDWKNARDPGISGSLDPGINSLVLEADQKSVFHFLAVNENADEKEIPFTAENQTKTKTDIHFRPKNENESHLMILLFLFFFFIHSVTMSALQCAANILSCFDFLQVVLVDGIPLSSCTAYRYLCGIFLDDISTHEQFAFLVYCYRVKAVFRNPCNVVYWRLCGLANTSHC